MVVYARRSTPRRAVPLALLALAELHRRRSDVRLVLFGEEHPMRTSFPYEHAGVLPEPELARLYREATVGVSLSLTNYSRVSQEMLACGLPCVELDTPSVRAALGGEDALTLAPFDPVELAEAIERLLDDPALRVGAGRGGAATGGGTDLGAGGRAARALSARGLAEAAGVPLGSRGA